VLTAGAVLLALLGGGTIAAFLADRVWVEAGMRVPSVVQRRGRRFLVVDFDDPEASCMMIEVLEAARDERENAAKIARMRAEPEPP
jgi:hypothetical protein